MKFTDITIRNLKPKEQKYYKRENNGFAICVYPTGVKSWFFIFTFEGKRYSMSLGSYPDVSLSAAKLKYNEAWKSFSAGKNPATLEREAQDERRRMPTVSDLAKEYIEKHSKVNKKSWKENERVLDKDVVPILGYRKVADVTPRDIILLLEGIIDRDAPIQSNNTLDVIRMIFKYAVDRGYLARESNPVLGVNPLSRKVKRTRQLSEQEIKTLWHSLDRCGMTSKTRRALKLILVTAQRPGEVIGMHRAEVDGHWWTIPGSRTKNGRTHRVYLTELALTLIGDKEGYIFESPRTVPSKRKLKSKVAIKLPPSKAIGVNALAHAVRHNCPTDCCNNCESCQDTECIADRRPLEEKNRLGIEFFRPHDLRRTATTNFARIKIPFEYREAILNHARDSLDQTYNLYQYEEEKMESLEKWSRELTRIVEGETIGEVIAA